MLDCDNRVSKAEGADGIANVKRFNGGRFDRSGLPSKRYALDREFSGFLDRQEVLTDLLDDMFHVKQ